MLNWRGHTLSQDDRLVEAFLTQWIMTKRYLTCPEHALSGQTTDEVICCCVGNSTNRQWFTSGVLVETYLSIYSIFNTVSRWWPDLASIDDICLVINLKQKHMFKILYNASLNEIECPARKETFEQNVWLKLDNFDSVKAAVLMTQARWGGLLINQIWWLWWWLLAASESVRGDRLQSNQGKCFLPPPSQC